MRNRINRTTVATRELLKKQEAEKLNRSWTQYIQEQTENAVIQVLATVALIISAVVAFLYFAK